MSFYEFEVSFYPQIVYLQQRINRWKGAPDVWGLIARQYIDLSVATYPLTPSLLQISNASLWLERLYWIFPTYELRSSYKKYLDKNDISVVTSSQIEMQYFFYILYTEIINELNM